MTLAALSLALEVSDNMDFGEMIVGAGTLALAGITGLLAWKTSSECGHGGGECRGGQGER
jgi:hypothetical protein